MTQTYTQRVLAAEFTPDFAQLAKLLNSGKADRPVLFEFYHNTPLYAELAGEVHEPDPALRACKIWSRAFMKMGYDHATLPFEGLPFEFPRAEHGTAESISLNEGSWITDRESFETYPWPEVDSADYSLFERLETATPTGLKWLVHGPCGVLENVIAIVGYENLCYMLIDEPDLAKDIFDAVGSRLLRHYERVLKFDCVGAILSNDDWGYKTQTMISPDDLRRYVFPWHRRIAAAAHEAGRPATLHSCGQLEAVFDEVIDDLNFDGKHSFEDNITPVEKAWERWGSRIVILGGLDLDFVCRSSPEEVYRRARRLLEMTADAGGYALGTGNSVPKYVPQENFFAMLCAGIDVRQQFLSTG